MTDIEKVELKVDEGKILYHYTFIPQVQHLKQELAELMEAAENTQEEPQMDGQLEL